MDNEIEKYFEKFQKKRIMVIGEASMDRLIIGDVERISPDAPVPLLNVTEEKTFLGSLGRVIKNINDLRGEVDVLTCVGKDYDGSEFIKSIKKMNKNIEIEGIFQYDEILTPQISRFTTSQQDLLRVEKKYQITKSLEKQINTDIVGYIKERIDRCDAILILDFNIGLLNPILISQILSIIEQKQKPVIVRPEAGKEYFYKNLTLVSMNRKIAEEATKIGNINETSMRIIGGKLKHNLKSQGLFIHWIEGISYYFDQNRVELLPSLLRNKNLDFKYNIGSSILAAITLMVASKQNLFDSIQFGHMVGSASAINDEINEDIIKEFYNKIPKN